MSDLVNKLVRATRNITIFDMNGVGDRRSLEDAYHGARYDVAERIEQLQRELETANGLWTFWNDKATELAGKLTEARRYAFFVGWEMSETGGMEDTCAEAWAFWSLMEDGRDEAEGRTKAQPHSETRQEQRPTTWGEWERKQQEADR